MLFFGVTLSPTLGFVDFHFMLFSFVADRFQYLACIGVLAVVIGAATRALAGGRGAGGERPAVLNVVLVAALLGVLGTLTWQHAANYRDGITFFRYIIAHNPQAREAHLNLGSAFLKWNRLEEALAAYRIAGQQRPEDCKPPYGAGLALYHLGRLQEAEEEYLRALQICPRYAAALADLGELRLAQQRYAGALAALQDGRRPRPRQRGRLDQPGARPPSPAPHRRSAAEPGPGAHTRPEPAARA